MWHRTLRSRFHSGFVGQIVTSPRFLTRSHTGLVVSFVCALFGNYATVQLMCASAECVVPVGISWLHTYLLLNYLLWNIASNLQCESTFCMIRWLCTRRTTEMINFSCVNLTGDGPDKLSHFLGKLWCSTHVLCCVESALSFFGMHQKSYSSEAHDAMHLIASQSFPLAVLSLARGNVLT